MKIIKSDLWETPQNLFNALNEKFNFEIDAACDFNNMKCGRGFDENSNGLIQDWHGRTFCNPPYSQKKEWIKKAIYEVENNGCPLVVMILPCTMECIREIKHYKYDVLNKRVSFIVPETKKPTKGNRTGTIIVYFWSDIKI